LSLDVGALPPEKVEAAIARLEAEKTRRVLENKLAGYRPYPKQREFHANGATHRERLLMAGNQVGKTLAAGDGNRHARYRLLRAGLAGLPVRPSRAHLGLRRDK